MRIVVQLHVKHFRDTEDNSSLLSLTSSTLLRPYIARKNHVRVVTPQRAEPIAALLARAKRCIRFKFLGVGVQFRGAQRPKKLKLAIYGGVIDPLQFLREHVRDEILVAAVLLEARELQPGENHVRRILFRIVGAYWRANCQTMGSCCWSMSVSLPPEGQAVVPALFTNCVVRLKIILTFMMAVVA